MIKYILGLCFFVQFSLQGQEHAWVYFTDKEDVANSINNPSSILSERAIARKARHSIPIDERDVPVNEGYIAQIKALSTVEVLAKSKWMNAIHVLGTLSEIQELQNLIFVGSIYYANHSLNGKRAVNSKETASFHTQKNKELLVDYEYGTSETQVQQIKIHALHELDYTGEGMMVAVMDAGFPGVDQIGAFAHLRENGKLLGGYDFPDRTSSVYSYSGNSHGTHVLSDMAGFIEGEFVGTAPEAQYILFRTEVAESETPVEESYWVEAAERADSLGVDVINTSLGYSTFDNPDYSYSPSDMDGSTAFISKGANIAVEKGILVVSSAGNSGNDTWGIITAPADANVYAVGAVDSQGNYVSFSSRGPNANGVVKPDGMAMGRSAAIITPSNEIALSNGTSFASPIMAGAITCLWQAYPNRTNVEIMQMVRESSSMYTVPNANMGYGIPDFSVFATVYDDEDDPDEQQGIMVYPNPVSERITIQLGENENIALVKVFTVSGRLVKEQEIIAGEQEIDVSALKSAIYIIEVKTDTGRKQLYKVARR